ncbi:MAG: PCI domain-containing protein [Promethearchaeota archaeon]
MVTFNEKATEVENGWRITGWIVLIGAGVTLGLLSVLIDDLYTFDDLIFIPIVLSCAMGVGILFLIGAKPWGKATAKQLAGSGLITPEMTTEEENVKGLVSIYPSITLIDLANKLNKSEGEVELLLIRMVDKKLISGHIDPGSKTFISGMVSKKSMGAAGKGVSECPNCGAPLASIPVKGTSIKCEACGTLITN